MLKTLRTFKLIQGVRTLHSTKTVFCKTAENEQPKYTHFGFETVEEKEKVKKGEIGFPNFFV